MYALISPNEPRADGWRVAEVAEVVFAVAPPLFWVECADSAVADAFVYVPSSQLLAPLPTPDVIAAQAAADQPDVTGAQTL